MLYRLRDAGFQACLVGGGVRDILLGHEPKDFDIGTDAHPEEIQDLFRNCRLIGRRFRLAHIRYGREVIEVATFRAQHDGPEDTESGVLQDDAGRIVRDNVYGSIEEDAWRRDFTINALYYDIEHFEVLDFVGGMKDLEEGVIRLIGDPDQRYREDPVRMLRAIRFAAKLALRIEPKTEEPIHRLGVLLEDISSARMYDEIIKLFMSGYAVQCFELLRLYGIFRHVFPETDVQLSRNRKGFPRTLLIHALENTDSRIAQGKSITPAFLFAALLWEPYRHRLEKNLERGLTVQEAQFKAGDETVAAQLRHTSIPKRFSQPMREIWYLQTRFEQRNGKRPERFLENPRFRAAYDFLLLREQAGDEVGDLPQWWTEYQEKNPQERSESTGPEPARRRRRAPRRRKPASSEN